jgi:hypothetical protein
MVTTIHDPQYTQKPNYIIRLNKISIQKLVVFFISLRHGKEHQIFGIRAIIEAIQAGTTVDKVYIQKKEQRINERLNESDEACQ